MQMFFFFQLAQMMKKNSFCLASIQFGFHKNSLVIGHFDINPPWTVRVLGLNRCPHFVCVGAVDSSASFISGYIIFVWNFLPGIPFFFFFSF